MKKKITSNTKVYLIEYNIKKSYLYFYTEAGVSTNVSAYVIVGERQQTLDWINIKDRQMLSQLPQKAESDEKSLNICPCSKQ